MKRVLLNQQLEIQNASFEKQYFVVDQDVKNIKLPAGVNADVLFNALPRNDELIIDVDRDSQITISFLAKDIPGEYKVTVNVKENSKIEAYFADFSSQKVHFSFVGNLLENDAVLNWHLSSLAASHDNKTFDISVNHIAPQTYARMDNYGVCKDDGKLVFSGISSINNGSRGSKTHQNSKIMVFDSLSNGIAKPILKIDENDIEASHAAVVGKINDEHLFYLTSRGLTEAEAKQLITFGYLKPIMNGFIEEEIKGEISSLIERRM